MTEPLLIAKNDTTELFILPILLKKSEWKDGVEAPTGEDETVNQASAPRTRADKHGG